MKDEVRESLVLRKMNATNSVLSYIKSPEGRETVNNYLRKRKGNSLTAKPNYSEMLLMSDLQTTQDGINFNSIYVDRSIITKELQKDF